MGKLETIDAFVCTEPEIEVDAETARTLERRVRTADEGRLVSAEEARRRIKRSLSSSATMKTR
jgi:hypothetical protein